MRDIREWARSQRKKGYTDEQLKRYLANRGYTDVGIGIMSDSSKPKISALGTVPLIVLAVAAVFIIFLFIQREANQEKIQPALPASEPLCRQFEDANYAVSCDEAVQAALAESAGTAKSVSLGSRKLFKDVDGQIVRENTLLWLVEVKLDEPVMGQSGKAGVMRIGISTERKTDIYTESVE